MLKKVIQSLLVIFCFSALKSFAAPLSYYLPADARLDPSVPTPESVFDHEVGEWHLTHDKLVNYMYALAEASPRVSIQEYGRTYENRPLLLLAITHPDNQARLAEIKQARSSLRTGAKPAEDMPVIVWLGHSIHGNEASGANSSPLTAYYWAAAQGEDIETLLKDTIILVDPSINPDGLNRFASWVNSHKSLNQVTDPENMEQNEAWPRARTNHYWFDLNRDWLPLQMPESQGRIAAIQDWKPNVLTDHHEMGSASTFFFQPGIPTRIHPLIPDQNYTITEMFGDSYAEALNGIGSLYFAKESYDDYYIGRGPTYLDFNGGIAILFEQASARSHAQESEHGVLTFPFGIRNHFTAATATVNTAHRLRNTLYDYMADYYTSAKGLAAKDRTKAYVFGDGNDPVKSYMLAEIALRHGIKVYELASEVSGNGKTFAPGSYIIPLDQPQYRLIQGMFEIRNKFEDNRFYDVSAWTLPLAFNLPYAPLTKNADKLLGQEVGLDATIKGAFDPQIRAYAYAFEWHDYFSPRALYKLLDAGVIAKVSMLPFTTVEGKAFDRGTIVIPLGIQPEKTAKIETLLADIASEDGIDIHTLGTGYTPAGPDLGSRNMQRVYKPSVMIVGDGGLSGYEVGELWHLLDQRYHMPVSIVDQARVGSVDLSRYTTIMLVDGNYSGFPEAALASIKAWVKDGGTLVAQKRGAKFAADNGLSTVAFEKVPDPVAGLQAYGDFESLTGAERIGGSIFKTQIDLTHPLGFGYTDSTLPMFKRDVMVMKMDEKSFAYPVTYESPALWSGYLSPAKTNLFDSTPAIAVSSLGKGKTISLTDNMSFRAFWFGTNKIIANGIFFGSLIHPGTTR